MSTITEKRIMVGNLDNHPYISYVTLIRKHDPDVGVHTKMPCGFKQFENTPILIHEEDCTTWMTRRGIEIGKSLSMK